MFTTKKPTISLIPVRIGGLLISAGLIRADQMQLALSQARSTNKKIGEVLSSSKLVSEEELSCALELQRLIKAGNITVEMGTRALKQAHEKQRNVHAALADMGYSDEKALKTNDLASILLEACIISKEQLQQASWNAAKNYLPLGRNLVLAGALSPSLLGASLTALVLLRDNVVERERIVQALQLAHHQKIPFEVTITEAGDVSPNHIRVGELLSAAGLVSESDAMIAVENGLLNRKSIGQVLLESQMISPLVLDACLKLQKLIQDGQLSRVQGTELLKQVAQKQVALDQFLSEMAYLKSRVLDLLVRAELVSSEQIQVALTESGENENDILRALFANQSVTQDMFRAGVRGVYAIDDGTCTAQDIINALKAQFYVAGDQRQSA